MELQPPADAQVDRYLAYLEATGTQLADVRPTLATDPELRELLRSPLPLHVVFPVVPYEDGWVGERLRG